MVLKRWMSWMAALALGLLLLATAMANAQRRGGGVQYGNYGYTPGCGMTYGNYGYTPGYGLNSGATPAYGYGYNPYPGSTGYTVPQWTGQANPYAYGAYNTMPSYQQSGVTKSEYLMLRASFSTTTEWAKPSLCRTSQALAWYIASSISTPGITGNRGKWSFR